MSSAHNRPAVNRGQRRQVGAKSQVCTESGQLVSLAWCSSVTAKSGGGERTGSGGKEKDKRHGGCILCVINQI